MLQHTVLSYKIDLYFLKQRLAIEVGEIEHRDRDESKEAERKKTPWL